MNRISKRGLPITLIEALATNDTGENLFVVPKILVFRSKETIGIGNIGSRNSKTVNFESPVSGYIPSVYGDQANELDRCFQQIQGDNKKMSIVGYLNKHVQCELRGVSLEIYRFINDEVGPHTGWIKIIAENYKLNTIK